MVRNYGTFSLFPVLELMHPSYLVNALKTVLLCFCLCSQGPITKKAFPAFVVETLLATVAKIIFHNVKVCNGFMLQMATLVSFSNVFNWCYSSRYLPFITLFTGRQMKLSKI